MKNINYNFLEGSLLYRSATGHFIQGHGRSPDSIFHYSNHVVGIIFHVILEKRELIINYVVRGMIHALHVPRKHINEVLSESGWEIDDGEAGYQFIVVI